MSITCGKVLDEYTVTYLKKKKNRRGFGVKSWGSFSVSPTYSNSGLQFKLYIEKVS